MTMQVFVREHCTVIAAPVQCDVDGVPKRSHFVRVPVMAGASLQLDQLCALEDIPFDEQIPEQDEQDKNYRNHKLSNMGLPRDRDALKVDAFLG